MTSGVPWQVQGVRREVIDSAREAARRSGMSVEEWLDTVISQSARSAGIAPAAQQRPDFDDRARQSESAGGPAWRRGPADHDSRARSEPSFAEVSARLDALSRQLDRLAHSGEAPARQQAPNRSGADATPDLITDAFSRLDRKIDRLFEDGRSASSEIERRMSAMDRAVTRLDQAPAAPAAAWSGLAGTVDQALAEIEARAADARRRPRRRRPMDLPRAPTQRLPDLEQQLRQVNARIDTMRPCGIDAAVETLRDDLAEIGVMLKEAMPRQAIEALESEVRVAAPSASTTSATSAPRRRRSHRGPRARPHRSS